MIHFSSAYEWTSGRSNFTQGSIDAAHELFSSIRQVAPMCNFIQQVRGSLGQLEPAPEWHLDHSTDTDTQIR